MKREPVRRLWVVFALSFTAFVYSVVVGAGSVHASGCDTTTCSQRESYARWFCNQNAHGGLAYFECPVAGETDDWLGLCVDGTFLREDCSTGNPS